MKKASIFVAQFVLAFVLSVGIAHTLLASPLSDTRWWYTNHPEIVSVNPSTGAMTAYGKGTATVCSQKSATQRTNIQCYSVSVAQVVK